MASIHEKLRRAAQAGAESELRAWLNDPGCDALAKDNNGLTALMHAARLGHQACIEILLPASDALAQDDNGFTASGWAADRGHKSLAQWIEAYAQAQSGRVALGIAASPGVPRGRAAFRM